MGDLVNIAEKQECIVANEWAVYRRRQLKAIRNIAELQKKMDEMAEHTANLEQLKKLDALIDIRDRLLNSATGRHHLDLPTAALVLKLLGIVIISLVFVIVFLLTGQGFGFLTTLGK
jgi:hypothetical protein